MQRQSLVRVVVLCAAVLASPFSTAQEADCQASVYILVDEASLTIPQDLKVVTVCRGGEVVWESNGNGPLAIVFPGRRPGDPVPGPPTRVEVQVGPNVEAGQYPYEIRVRDQIVDPTIIVR